jgi:hypothetical protein
MSKATIGFQVASGLMKMQAARAEARGLAAQATQSRVQARSEALKYKQQGVAVLNRILENEATIIARAGAGTIDPFSGSAMALRFANEAKGADEFFLTKEGATIVTASGETQANQYMAQGRAGIQAATMGAVLGIGMKGYEVNKLGSEATLQPFALV